MVAVLQRASEGKVTVDGRVTGEIGTGLVILLGVTKGDSEEDADFLADRIAGGPIPVDEALSIAKQVVSQSAGPDLHRSGGPRDHRSGPDDPHVRSGERLARSNRSRVAEQENEQ